MDVNKYDISWVDFTAEKISYYLDSFLGVDRQSFEREPIVDGLKKSNKILKPDNDAYRLEAERIAAINTYKSKGFTIIDITPGFLDSENNACSIRPSWLFDGVNFLNWTSWDSPPTQTLRSVDFEIPGNFIKIEFIQEINALSNTVEPARFSSGNFNVLGARPKYDQVFQFTGAPKGLVLNLDQSMAFGVAPTYYDVFSRKNVWISFNSQMDVKPHIVKNGDSFNTYFSSFTIHCSVGAPKIRVTIGEESTIVDGPSEGPINSQIHLTGCNSLLKNLDQVLQPLVLTDANIQGLNRQGRLVANLLTTTGGRIEIPMVASNRDTVETTGQGRLINYGYSVFWITSVRFKATYSRAIIETDLITFKLTVASGIRGADPYYYSKQYVSCFMGHTGTTTGYNDYQVINFTNPIRVVVPPQSSFTFEIDYSVASNVTITPIFEIYGYSLGGITEYNLIGVGFQYLMFTKFITDASLLDDFYPYYMDNNYSNL